MKGRIRPRVMQELQVRPGYWGRVLERLCIQEEAWVILSSRVSSSRVPKSSKVVIQRVGVVERGSLIP